MKVQNVARQVQRLAGMCCLWCGLTLNAQANCLDQQLRGVNLSGAEFSSKRLPGKLHQDYIYPSLADLRHFRQTGMNIVRLPFRWERLQHQALAPLVPADVEQLQRVIGWAKELNLCILLDMHNYGTYFGQPLGSPEVPASAFIDVWLRLLKAFPDATTTAFGLMNEPAAIPAATWLEIAQQSVLALRQAGSGHLLMVASGRWSGAHEWAKNIDGVSAASQFRTFHDPRQNLVIELHQYADANHSGTGSSCVAASRMQAIMAPLALWSRQEKKRFFLGEFGANTSPACMAAMATLLDAMQDRSVWLGWTYWSAGPWWGAYPYSIAPAEQEAPQLTLLRRHLPP